LIFLEAAVTSRRLACTVLACAVLACPALVTAGCASTSPATSKHGPKVTVQVRTIAGVGKVLVTAKGYALYMFQPDNQRSVTCTGACAGTWPPVKVPGGGSFAAGPGVDGSLLGTDPDPEGGDVLTYNGWPLYTYTGDVQSAQATGQAIDLNGGEWYVLRPDGKPLVPTP
jgi:predicted lipoprotein with Yx(FWY)xxD motif